MKKTQIYMILFCLISFALGCVADRMVLILTAPEPQETDPHELIRISDQSVQVYDKDKWIEIDTVEKLSERDPFVLTEEEKEALKEQLIKENENAYQEALDSLSKKNNEPVVKKKEIKRPVVRPNQTPDQSVPDGSGNTSSGGSSAPSVPSEPTPPPSETPPSESGDGENMEWSNDYL